MQDIMYKLDKECYHYLRTEIQKMGRFFVIYKECIIATKMRLQF